MAEKVQEPKKEKRKAASALFIPAGLFLGLGIGLLMGHIVEGMFIGLGTGFLLFAVIMLVKRD